MKNKKIVIITIIAVLALVLITLGVTYAFFNYLREGTTENTIDSGSISFVYEEVNKIGNGINIVDALPTSDSDGKKESYFEFKVTSNTSIGNVEIPYEITGRITEESSYLSNYVKIYLTKVNGTIEEEKVLSMYNNLTDSTNELAKEYNDKTIYKDYIPAGSRNYTETYRLRMWLNENVNDGNVIDFSEVNGEYPSQNKTFSMKINVYANGNKASNEKVITANTTTISSIEANNVTALLNEDSNNNYDYYLELEYGTQEATISIEPTNPKATVEIEQLNNYAMNKVERISKTESFNVNEGANYFKITVTSENRKNDEEYILKVKVLEGNDVAYYVDNTLLREDFYIYGADVLNPTNLTVTKEGWEFIGWKDTEEADSNVLTQKIMVGDKITLHAVFRKNITITYDGNSSTSGTVNSDSGYIYYNSGNIKPYEVTLPANQYVKTDFNFSRWAINSIDGEKYRPNDKVDVSGDTTFYAYWVSSIVTIYSSSAGWATGTDIIVNKGSTGTSLSAGNGSSSSGWFKVADLDLTNVTKLTVSGGASASGTTDAGCGTSTSYKLDNTSGTTWNTTSMTGTHTLYMYASLRASGPHEDQWVYKCTSWHSTSSIKANTIFIDE